MPYNVYGYRIHYRIHTINRYPIFPLAHTQIRPMFDTMLGSLQSIFAWLDSFLVQPAAAAAEQQQKVRKAAHLLLRHFAPFLSRSLFHCFPYEQLARQHFRAEFCTGEEYVKFLSNSYQHFQILLSIDLEHKKLEFDLNSTFGFQFSTQPA
jgi:hypothetical protein